MSAVATESLLAALKASLKDVEKAAVLDNEAVALWVD